MSKVLNVPDGNYTVRVQEGGTITLNTGNELGEVRITGNLTVLGDSTTVESENLTVRDNIIVINEGETGSGITLQTAGIRIDRGNLVDSYIVFDEAVTWRDPVSETTISGGFVLKNDLGGLVGLRTNSISTGGGDLYLINSGSGVLSVTGTTNYEEQVFVYSGGNNTGVVQDDDIIPNTKSVVDYIDFQFANVFLSQIGDGEDTITSITITDEETSGVDSVIEFAIDANVVSRLYADRWEFDEIRIIGTTIETTSSNEDLVLSAPGTGSVVVNDTLRLSEIPGIDDPLSQPLQPDSGLKLYASDQGTGKTGLYYVNSNSIRDELISKNRALLFGMLF